MKNKLYAIALMALMLCNTNKIFSQATSANGTNNPTGVGEFLGWANGNNIAVDIMNKNNYPIDFYTGSTPVKYMTILGSTNPGFVGIGIATPQNKIHLDAGSLQITNATTGSSTAGKGLLIGQSSSGSANVEINQQENAPMNFLTNGAARLKIQSDGKVALGNYATFTANSLLHQYVNSATETYHQFTNSTTGAGSGTTGLQVGIDANGNAIFKNNYSSGSNGAMNFYTAATNRLTISNAGYVGIAEPNPTALFEVYNNTSNTGTPILAANNMVNYASGGGLAGINLSVLDLGSNNTVGGLSSTVEGDDTDFLTAGMFTGNYGDYNIGIDVNAIQGNTDTYGVRIFSYGKESTTVNNIFGLHATASVGSGGSANLVYGVYATGGNNCTGTSMVLCPQAAAYFSGNVGVSGTVYDVSDINLKQNILPITNAGQILSQLNPVSFEFKTQQYPSMHLSAGNQYGLIAQDVAAVSPNLVAPFTEPEVKDDAGNVVHAEVDFLAVNYTGIIPLLIQDLNTQRERVDSLLAVLTANPGQKSNNSNDENEGKIKVTLENVATIYLSQNLPNPFEDHTTITFSIPVEVKTAQIIFTENNGIVLKSVTIEQRGESSLTVFGENLSKGIYSYSLIIDGTVFETKKMVKM